jgi:TolB-like protein
MPRVMPTSGDSVSSIPVKVGAATCWIRVHDIRLVTACENYTELTLAENQRLLVRRTMRDWVALLPAVQFARVHRGLLVNLETISQTERGEQDRTRVYFSWNSAAPLDVKRRHWPALRRQLDQWRIATRPRATEQSIAILPFANLGPDPDDELFGEGIYEELLNHVAKIGGLRTTARATPFTLKGKNLATAEVGRRFGARFLLKSSVRRAGRSARISVQLIHAPDGALLWAESYDRELTDVFRLQAEIARDIATNLRTKLGRTGSTPGAANPRAHSLTLEARYFLNLRTPDGFVRAESALRQSLELDPMFAPAHAALADAGNLRALYRLAEGESDVTEDLRVAKRSAKRALQLDATLGEAHATLACIEFHEGRLHAASDQFAQTFVRHPNYATGRHFFAWTLAAQGRLTDALAEYQRAVALDPLSFIAIDRHASMLTLAGRLPEALAANERAAALRPDLVVSTLAQHAVLLLALGQPDAAVAEARHVRKISGGQDFCRTADAEALAVLRRAGAASEASAYANEMLQRLPVKNYRRGFVLAAAGRADESLASLAFTPSLMLPQLYWSDLLDEVRHQPEFATLLTRLKRTNEYAVARHPQNVARSPGSRS